MGRRTDRVKRRETNEMSRLHLQGLTDTEIAARLNRKTQTVKHHLSKRQMQFEQNSLIIEAQKKHLDEIESLLTSWQSEIEFAQLVGAYEIEYKVEEYSQPVIFVPPREEKKNPLFPYALQHCPFVNEEYQVLKAQRDQYNSKIEELASTIDTEAPKEATEDFSKFAARYAVYAALGQSLPDYKKIGGVDFLYVHEGRSERAIAGGSPEVLECCQEQHAALIHKYERDSRVARLLSFRESLRDTQKALGEIIEQTLIKRGFISYKCEACQK